MRQMVFLGPGKLDWDDVKEPVIEGPGEAIVRPIVVGRCDLDVLYLSGRMPLAPGEPIGHEIIGEIVDLGETAAQHFTVGDRVIVPAQISCGVCRMCRSGETARCEAAPLGASYSMGRAGNFGGAVSDLVRVPFATGMLVPIPQSADPVQMIGLADMASDAWRAVGPQLAKRPGGSVLVIGGATPVIGIYAAGLAVRLGAGRVVYVDEAERHRAAAENYGAEVYEHVSAAPDAIFDIVVDAGGDGDLFKSALGACGPAAQLTSVAPPFVADEIPLIQLYYLGLNYTLARPNCRHGHDGALGAWASCGFDPSLVGPKVYRFDNAIEAWLDDALYVAVTTDPQRPGA